MSPLRTVWLLAVFCVCAVQTFPDIEVGGERIVGGFLKAKVTGEYQAEAVSVQLCNGSGLVLSKNLLFQVPDRGEGALYALLGIPESMDEGTYTIRVTTASDVVLESSDIAVSTRSFRSETIHFNETMSELLLSDNERRVKEAKQLLELLNHCDVDALYHFGPFHVPVEDSFITSYFGDRRLYVYPDESTGGSVHAGIDLAAPSGTPVNSSGRGMVVFAGDRLISGNTVIVVHLPCVYTLYYHLDEIRVSAGDHVTEESVLGTLGSTGLATGPHLHWELRIGGIGVDPEIMTGFSF